MIKKLFKQKLDRLYFFVHIPKTAGTSFRNGIESLFKVACHYKKDSENTSKLVISEIYEKNDKFAFYQKIKQKNYTWISGHVSIAEYQEVIDPRNIVTFLREPVARTYSLFGHKKKYLGYTGEIDDFVQDRRFINSQSKLLQDFPLELIGFIGITESYNESLKLINSSLKTDIPILKSNVAIKDKEIAPEIKQMIRKLNDRDNYFYKKASWLLEQRIMFDNKKLAWGHATAEIVKGKVIGLAWYSNSDDAVELQLEINNQAVATTFAKSPYYGDFKSVLPRLGFVAYSFKLNSTDNGKDIKVKIKDTQQLVNFETLMVDA